MKNNPRIAIFTGTYGEEQQNGVGRFYEGLHAYLSNRHQRKPKHRIFSSGDPLERHDDVYDIHALSFPVPGFSAIKFYYPLEGRRDQAGRVAKQYDVVSAATPDMIGWNAATFAREMGRPFVGTYHTDFPEFAKTLVRQSLQMMLEQHVTPDIMKESLLPGLAYSAQHIDITPEQMMTLHTVLSDIIEANRQKIMNTIESTVTGIANAAEIVVREYMWQFYHRCHLVIARSEIYRQKLITELGLPPDAVKTLKPGVDKERFSPDPTEADHALRERLGIPEGKHIVLHVGRVSSEKNIDFLADAWRAFRASEQGRDAVFVLAGSGDLDGFRKKAGDDAVYTIGPVFGDDLPALYRAATVKWTASIAETLGQTILEAQSCGTPVMVTDKGAGKENVRHEETGLILPADDPAVWADALTGLLSDAERLRTMGAIGRESVGTIQESYEHFLSLHRDVYLHEKTKEKQPFRGKLPILVPAGTEPLRKPRKRDYPTTHITDFHAGHGANTSHKRRALQIIARRAHRRNAIVINHGDSFDTRPPLNRMMRELKMMRSIFASEGITIDRYIEGNHDYEFARAGSIGDVLDCPVVTSLVDTTENGLALTHGHVSELAELPGILQLDTREKILEALQVEHLKDRLKMTAFIYDVISYVEEMFDTLGLKGIEDLWRNIMPVRQRVMDALHSIAQSYNVPSTMINAIVHMLGSSSRDKVLADVAKKLGCWGIVYGHTHDPQLVADGIWLPPENVQPELVARPAVLADSSSDILIGNAGSFRRRSIPITWIETQTVDGPHVMELYGYDPKKDAEILIDRKSVPVRDQQSQRVTNGRK